MGNMELGRKRVEQYIMEVARETSRADAVGALLWWPVDAPNPDGGAEPDGVTEPLRIFGKGTSWRSMEIARSDIHGCAEAPELLTKYVGEITEILAAI